jgi:DNA repair exonuclease SbcCD ATPase subunit
MLEDKLTVENTKKKSLETELSTLSLRLKDVEEKCKEKTTENAKNILSLQQAQKEVAGEKDNVANLQGGVQEISKFLKDLLNGEPTETSFNNDPEMMDLLEEVRQRFGKMKTEMSQRMKQLTAALEEALKSKEAADVFAVERGQFGLEKTRLEGLIEKKTAENTS